LQSQKLTLKAPGLPPLGEVWDEVSDEEYLQSFQWPLQEVSVTSDYGQRGKRFHEGIDLKARVGTPVFAAQSGVVLYAHRKVRGYGNMIVLRHPKHYTTVYAHHSRLLVQAGQKVHKGQPIALSGRSGRCTGPHLHFELRRGLESMNPWQVLSASYPTPDPLLLASLRKPKPVQRKGQLVRRLVKKTKAPSV
jgi:murein DD-endopeptidase MepM/ murein hydrolase activator NlpD